MWSDLLVIPAAIKVVKNVLTLNYGIPLEVSHTNGMQCVQFNL